MSDGASHGPYRPITDSDILPDHEVGLILDEFMPDNRERITRHMMAMERKIAREARAAGGEQLRQASIAARHVVFAARAVTDAFTSEDEPHLDDEQSDALRVLVERVEAYDQRNHGLDAAKRSSSTIPPSAPPSVDGSGP